MCACLFFVCMWVYFAVYLIKCKKKKKIPREKIENFSNEMFATPHLYFSLAVMLQHRLPSHLKPSANVGI